MGALLALIPVKDWIYGGIIAVLLTGFGVYTVHERHEGAAHETAVLQKSSAELQAKAAEQVRQVATAYAQSSAAITGKFNDQIQAASAQHDSDAQRLREYDTYRRQHPALASPAGSAGTENAGAVSANTDDSRFASLEQVALGLATAGREVNAALTACMADRDAVTGK